MGDFDITKSRSSFFANLNKRKKLGLDTDSDSDSEGEKRTKTISPTKSESNKPTTSQAVNGETQQTTSTNGTTTNNNQPTLPDDGSLATLTQHVQQGLQQLQQLQIQQQQQQQPHSQQKPNSTPITLDDEDWLADTKTSQPKPSDHLINLSSDEEEEEPIDPALLEGLDPELKEMVFKNNNRVDKAKPNKIDIRLQYVNEQTVNVKLHALLDKLLKPIKIRVMDNEQFDKVLTVFCTHKKLKKEDTVLVYKEDKVYLRATPLGLGMKPNEDYMLHVYPRHAYEAKLDKEKNEREERFQKRREQENMMERLLSNDIPDEAGPSGSSSLPPAEEQDQRIVVILRDKDGEEVNLRVKATTTLKALIESYKRVRKLAESAQIKLQFEGETLDHTQTIEDIGLEDEDLVDVLISS